MSNTTTALDRVLTELGKLGTVRQIGGSYSAQCPAHEDHNPSLSVRGIDGQALIYCHAGCESVDVAAALGMGMADLFDKPSGREYRYDNGRTVFRTPEKRFRQAHTDRPPELYRLAEVRRAIAAGNPVIVAEGEKDCDAARSAGHVATCCPMGAGKWGKVDPSPLFGGRVLVVADNDEPGMRHAAEVAASLAGHAEVTVWKSAAGKDLADHVTAGKDLAELVPIPLGNLPGNSTPARRLVLTPASTITLRAPRWVWDTAPRLSTGAQTEGRIPAGALTIAAGRAGIGKSQHAAWLAAHLTRGTLPGCHWGTPKSVIYAASEDSWSMTIAPRLVAVGADMDRVFRIEVEDDHDPHARLTLPTDTRLLEDAITSNDVALMVLDPLLSLLDAGINDYRAREVREALEPLLPIADRTGAALFGLAHFTKATGSDPLMLISGSGAFGQLVRAGIGYAKDDGTDDDDTGPRYVMSTIKSNLGREDLPSWSYKIQPTEVDTDDGPAWVSRLEFTGTADRSVGDVLRDSHLDDDGRSERDEAVSWLESYLSGCGGQAPAGDVIKAAGRDGIARATLGRARKAAGITSTKGGMQSGWTWYLPTGRTHEEPEELTHTGVSPSSPSVSPSEPLDHAAGGTNVPPDPDPPPITRPCGHPGNPAVKCGRCIAEGLNTARECDYCTRPALPGTKWCGTDDAAHQHARELLGAAS